MSAHTAGKNRVALRIIGITTKADQFARLRVTLSVMLIIIIYFIQV